MTNDSPSSQNLGGAFGQKGASSAPSAFLHPLGNDILRKATELLEEVPTGRILLPVAKEFDVRIEVVIGREPNVFTFGDNRISLVCPKLLTGVNDYEIAVNLAIGLREVELNYTGKQLVSGDLNSFYYRTVDIVILMCAMVSEFYNHKNHQKLVDLMEKLGHSEVYNMYRENAPYEALREKIISVISERK